MTSYCQYTPDKKEQSTQNQTKICAIIVFYVYFVLYIELLFGDVGLNGSLNGKNSTMVSKKYNLAKNGSITIPCLNCIIFFVGHLASHFLIATTVGYQSDSIRSRVSFVNGNEQIGVTIAYSKEDTLEAYSGKFTISNTRDSMDVIVIGIKNYSKV